jgi:hypothetical protein
VINTATAFELLFKHVVELVSGQVRGWQAAQVPRHRRSCDLHVAYVLLSTPTNVM